MANRWIVTALGQDRPGIVAGVTRALYKLGCNLEDSAMTRLEGEFAIMLIFSCAVSVKEAVLRRAFAPLERGRRLVVHLKALKPTETRTPRRRGQPYVLSVYGGDKPGIVYQVSALLAQGGVNITDVHTHRSGGGPPWLYLMILELEVPPKQKLDGLERRLKQLGRKLSVQVSLRPAEIEVL